MRADPGRRQLFGDIPPPGAPLHREVRVLAAGEPPRQPRGQVRPVRRGDLPTLQLAGGGVEIVEGDLLPVNVQPAYDGHRDSSSSRGRASARTRMLTQTIVTRLSWGGLLSGSARQLQPQPMHVIFGGDEERVVFQSMGHLVDLQVLNERFCGDVRPAHAELRIKRFGGADRSGGDADALGDMTGFATELGEAISSATTGFRTAGYSWAEIAARLGVTRQAAQQRLGRS